MSNTPKQPEDPPTGGTSPSGNPPGQGKDGIAAGQPGETGMSWPGDDRQDTETAPSRIESDSKP